MSVSGRVVKGPIGKAVVEVFSLTPTGEISQLLATAVKTGTDGSFSTVIASTTAPIAVRVTGASGSTYRDEAAGLTRAFTADDHLEAVFASPQNTSGVTSDPGLVSGLQGNLLSGARWTHMTLSATQCFTCLHQMTCALGSQGPHEGLFRVVKGLLSICRLLKVRRLP